MKVSVFAVAFVALLCHSQVKAQCRMGGEQCPGTPGPYNPVEITAGDTYRDVETSQCPPYANPNWMNPNLACELDVRFRIPLNPRYAQEPIPLGEAHSRFNNILYLKEDPAPILGVIGVLLNGVSVFGVGSPCGFSSDCPSEGTGAPTDYVDAVEAEGHTVDQCGGHGSPTNLYHVHSGIFINTTAGRQACNLTVDTPGQHSELLGWMFDGFGLYGHNSLGGVPPTDLDECGGHTHEINGNMVYHYHLPNEFPWVIGCFKGCPEVSNNERELGFVNTDSRYGCPEGLDSDPGTGSESTSDPSMGTGSANKPTTLAFVMFTSVLIVLTLIF